MERRYRKVTPKTPEYDAGYADGLALETRFEQAVSALLAIAHTDYRGNRSSESHMAQATLKDLGRWPE